MLVKSLLLAAVCFAAVHYTTADTPSKVLCYYDARSYVREGLGKMLPHPDIEPALSFCTHLVYGHAGIHPETFKMVSRSEQTELDSGKALFREVTAFKAKFPGLKVLLSVGSDADFGEDKEKYLTLLESTQHRMSFINSAYSLVKGYNFDGIVLSWNFPPVKPKKIRSGISSFWHSVKKTFGAGSGVVDEKAAEHKEQFTSLIREVKNAFRHDAFMVGAAVNPNVNASDYFDSHEINNHLDFIVMHSYDYLTPQRNPKEADYTSPIYPLHERNPDSNVDSQVTQWITSGIPASKLILGIPTFGRTWKLTTESAISGVPPLTADGPGEAGPQGNIAGLFSYPETCAKLSNPNNLKGADAKLRKVTDPSKRYGTYGFRLPDESGEHGLWVSYEDPDTAGNKAGYVRAKGLGGIAIVDLGFDDFRGVCSGDKFPILRAAKYRLL